MIQRRRRERLSPLAPSLPPPPFKTLSSSPLLPPPPPSLPQPHHNHLAMSADNTSNRVYVKDESYGWVPAKVVAKDAGWGKVTVTVRNYANEAVINSDGDKPNKLIRGSSERTVDLSDYDGSVLPLQNVNEDGVLREVSDMVDLPFLHEVRILAGLHHYLFITGFFSISPPRVHHPQSPHRLPSSTI